MSEHAAPVAVSRCRYVDDVDALLTDVELFAGLREVDLAGLARAFTLVELVPGEVLWRQGTAHEGMYVLLDGEVQVSRRLPGQRELELTRLGAGEVMGEIAQLGGGVHAATVRAIDHSTLLFLRRAEFDAHTTAGDPGAIELRRRIVAIACARLRHAYHVLGEQLGDEPPPADDGRRELSPAWLPPREYLSRLAFFSAVGEQFVTELLSHARTHLVARGSVVQAQGAPVHACSVVLNGAVEDVVGAGPGLPRVAFAGPGHVLGAVGLLDGAPAPAVSIARERTLLLAIDGGALDRLLEDFGPCSRMLRAAIEADVVSSLETAERALSRLAAQRL